MISQDNWFTRPRFRINHLDWNTGSSLIQPDRGSTRLLPDNIDFSTVEVRDLRITGGQWTEYAETRLYAEEDQTHLWFLHAPAGGFDVDFTLVFGRGDLAIKTEWNLSFFAWDEKSLDDPSYWKDLYRSKPLATAKRIRLGFGRGRDFWAEGVPVEKFTMLATTEVDLPAGDLKITSRSDDGVRISVDGESVFERWQEGFHQGESVIKLRKGNHVIKVEYLNFSDESYLFLKTEML